MYRNEERCFAPGALPPEGPVSTRYSPCYMHRCVVSALLHRMIEYVQESGREKRAH